MDANLSVASRETQEHPLLDIDVTIPITVARVSSEGAESGARRFLVAILQDAIRSFQKYAFSKTRRSRRLFREVEIWYMEPDVGTAIPFEHLCDLLDLSADHIRRRLRWWLSLGAQAPERPRLPRRPAAAGLRARHGINPFKRAVNA